MRIGEVIKYHRIEGNFTQEELAKDICSVSYLSKIENNFSAPSDEIIELLLKKLGILGYIKENKENNKEVEKYLDEKYRDILENKIKLDIAIDKFIVSESKYKVLSQLISCRYLIHHQELEKAASIINRVEKVIESLSVKEQNCFFKNKGLLNYYKGNYDMAIKDYNQCLLLNTTFSFPEYDLADLFFQLALTHGKLLEVKKSIEYTQKALEYYNKEYNYQKSADCQVLLGISYQRLEEYEASLKSYNHAFKIAENINDLNLMSTINHNIGYLYALSKESFLAIEHFEKSLKLRLQAEGDSIGEVNLKKALNTIHSLVQLFYKDNKLLELEKYISLGINLIEDYGDRSIFTEYLYHLNVYKKIVEEPSICLDYLENLIVPFFSKKGNKRYVYKYAKMLAQIYESKRKYKKGIYYYGLANKTIESLIPKTIIE